MSSAAGSRSGAGSSSTGRPEQEGISGTTRDSVADYYRRNTGIFLRLGGGRSTGSIHRPLWAEGVTTVEDALSYAYRLVEAEARNINLNSSSHEHTGRMHILDLGCGVGGAAIHLTAGLGPDIHVSGVTLSTEQAKRATHEAHTRGVANQCEFVVGDFLELPDIPPVDLAFSIEAFVHGSDPAGFFREAARVIRPGGRLVIIDDMERDNMEHERGANPTHSGRRAKSAPDWVEQFRAGWHATSLRPRSTVISLAEAAGFRTLTDENLYPLLHFGRFRDKFIRRCVAPLGRLIWWHPYGRSLIGGNALQHGLERGLIEYRLLVFERAP